MRLFSPQPPPPSDAAADLEALQGELRQDRQELLSKVDSFAKSLEDRLDVLFQATSAKLDSTKAEISMRAAGYALGGATLAVSALGLFLDAKPS